MRSNITPSITTSSLVTLKDQYWLKNQRVAGKIAAHTLMYLQKEIENKTSASLLELNKFAEDLILSSGGIPTFKGYKGFPAGVCISVNNQLVHGIPTNYHLQDGDVVSFDLGVTFNGCIADTAITCIYGTAKSEKHTTLINITEQALIKGIESISIGKRLGCIGNAINHHIKNNGFNVITKYGGHGIDISNGIGIPHALPFVSNKSNSYEGIRIQPGLVLAIEPMAIIGNTDTYIDKDGWTVYGHNISAHVEHSIFVHNDRVEIITWRSNEQCHKEIMFKT